MVISELFLKQKIIKYIVEIGNLKIRLLPKCAFKLKRCTSIPFNNLHLGNFDSLSYSKIIMLF
jgi:hypothetical protein